MKRHLLQLFTFLTLTVAQGQTSAKILAAGYDHSLYICDNSVMAWGKNSMGQLGNGTNTSSNVPLYVSLLTDVISIAGGGDHSLALKNDSTVWAWGYNGWGELGNGTNTDSNVPVLISSLERIIAISGCGYGHSIALKNDGTVWTWGRNSEGQLGNGSNTNSNIPVQVTSLTNITEIVIGGYHSLALKNDSTVWAWGVNDFGQLGNGSNTDSNIPVQVLGLSGIIAVAAGGYAHSLALKNDGTVWTWGYNLAGQLGNGTNTDSNVPVQVSFLAGITMIAGGGNNSLALKNDSTVWAWGFNGAGALGNGTYTDSNVPIQISALTDIIDVAGGGSHCFAMKSDNTVWAWGNNDAGALGNGNNTASLVPVETINLCTPLAVNEITKELSISIFPNPFSSITTLQLNEKLIGGTLTIYNSIGQQVKQISSISEQTITLYRENLPSGVYFVNILKDSKTFSKKVLITDK